MRSQQLGASRPGHPSTHRRRPGPERLDVDRRGFLGGVLGTTALLGIGGCGADRAETGGPSRARVAFSYTDARGVTVRLPSRPNTVVAQSSTAASLWDAGYRVAGVYGELGTTNGKLNYQAGAIDLSEVTVIGKTHGQFNIERYAALEPDLLVDASMDDKTLWYVPPDAASEILAVAPSIGVKMVGLDLPAIIEEFVDLAHKLGADPQSPALREARSDFDDAVAQVRASVAARPGLRVLAVSRDPQNFWVGSSADHPDLQHLDSLGVRFVDPGVKRGTYFRQLSWEQMGAHPADVLIYDAREAPAMRSKVESIGTWRSLPAVKAGQVYPWWPAAPFSYRAYAPLYRDVARWLRTSERLV